MDCIPAYILAGGKSSRFGSDKAVALFAGRPLIQRLADAVRPHVDRVVVVAERMDKYAHLGLRTIADLEPGLGPMGGLLTALGDCTDDEWLFLLACDLLSINPDWLGILRKHRTRTSQVVAFKPDRWQPLLALYKTSIRPLVLKQVRSSDRSMQSILSQVDVAEAPVPLDWPIVLQANTPDDLRKAGQTGGSRFS